MTTYKYTNEGHIEKVVDGTRTIQGVERDVVTKTLILSTSDEFAELEEDESIEIEAFDPDGAIVAAEELEALKGSGMEYGGVYCPGTIADQNKINTRATMILGGASSVDVSMSNGQKLTLTSENCTDFVTQYAAFCDQFE